MMTADANADASSNTGAEDDGISWDRLGAHSPCVDAICDLVSAHPGGKAIALTGRWGSGKSLIVDEVRNRAHGRPAGGECDVGVFVFDAWAHEGEALGRAFIWGLLEFLGERKWEIPAYIDAQKQNLTQRGTTADALQLAEVTVWSAVHRAVMPLLTVGVVTLGYFKKVSSATALISVTLLVAAAALVPPCLVWLAFGPLARFRGRAAKARAEIDGKPATRTTSVSYEELGPTTFEFQQTFTDLLSHALLAQTSRRLVVVLENIDRMDPRDTRAIWSTLRTFYQPEEWSRSHRTKTWFNQYWLLVPFDDKALAERDAPDRPALAGYLEKLFDYRFRVPVSFFSDWDAFLKATVAGRKEELPPTPNLANLVGEVYSLAQPQGVALADADGLYPTPRALERFVGDLVSIHRIRPTLLPSAEEDIVAKAIYAATGRGDDFRGSLYADGFARYSSHYGFDVQAAMVALEFAVSYDDAGEFGLRGRIGEALTNASVDLLGDCARHASFDVHLSAELARQSVGMLSESHVHLAPRAAYTMTRAKVGSREAWALLIQAVVRDVQWHVWDEYVRDGLLDILNRPEVHGDDSYVDRLLAGLAASPKADEVAAADAFINVISAVLAWRDRTRGAAVSHRALTVCDDPGAYVAIMQSTLLAPRIAIHLHPRFDTDELMAHLAEVDIQHWETLAPNLAAVGPGWPWADAGSEAFAAVVGVIVHDRTAAGEPPTTSGRIEEIEVRLAGTRHDAEDGAGYQDAIDESADRLDMLALPEVAESPRRVGTVLLYLLELLPEEPPKTGAGWDRYVAFMNALGARTLDEEQADALAEMIQLAQRYDRMPSLTGRAFDSERLAHEFRLFLPHFVEAYDGMYLDVTGLKRLIDAKHVGGAARDDYQRALDRAGKA